eukprot:s445_g10.t1
MKPDLRVSCRPRPHRVFLFSSPPRSNPSSSSFSSALALARRLQSMWGRCGRVLTDLIRATESFGVITTRGWKSTISSTISQARQATRSFQLFKAQTPRGTKPWCHGGEISVPWDGDRW